MNDPSEVRDEAALKGARTSYMGGQVLTILAACARN